MEQAASSPSAQRALEAVYRPLAQRYQPEDSPFSTVFVDVTHRCNMVCANCYIPNRALPDFPAETMYAALRRFPRRTRIRLVGAEPTLREDLPELIAGVRAIGHLPIILSNGLRLTDPAFVGRLKAAGLRTLHLSLNGGLRDDLYVAIDGLACARRKLDALDVLAALHMNVTVGMILVRGINECHLSEFLQFLDGRREVRDIHLRSVGPIGRHLEGDPLSLDELEDRMREALGARSSGLRSLGASGSSRDFGLGPVRVQLTEWPDLGSSERGRLTPDGFVEPMFESIVLNAGGY